MSTQLSCTNKNIDDRQYYQSGGYQCCPDHPGLAQRATPASPHGSGDQARPASRRSARASSAPPRLAGLTAGGCSSSKGLMSNCDSTAGFIGHSATPWAYTCWPSMLVMKAISFCAASMFFAVFSTPAAETVISAPGSCGPEKCRRDFMLSTPCSRATMYQ